MKTIIIDVETTGLLQHSGAPLINQPFITEICCIKIDYFFNQIDIFESFVKPPIKLPFHITKLTGITETNLYSAPSFPQIFKSLCNFFSDTKTLVGHNLSFDLMVLVQELKRLKKQYSFPYPPVQFCTLEQSVYLTGHRLKNAELYKIATGKELTGGHRAKADVLATLESYKWLKNKNH